MKEALRRAAEWLEPGRAPLLEAWARAVEGLASGKGGALRAWCARDLESLLLLLAAGQVDELLAEDGRQAARLAQDHGSFPGYALAVAAFDRCCLPFLLDAAPDREAFTECQRAVAELGARRLQILLRAREEEAGRQVLEAENEAARASERTRDLARANEALRRSEAQSQHRAEQIGLLGSVSHRIVAILDPERLMQEAAETIQARMNHTYVAVVVLDHEGVLVGRWAGRSGVGRRSAGRAQGPAGGIIGRALRKKAPQVVADVSKDPDYLVDVPGTHSEMVIPLLDGGEAVGAIDFQTERAGAFDLDAVAVGETLAEFLVVALRNARLFAEAQKKNG